MIKNILLPVALTLIAFHFLGSLAGWLVFAAAMVYMIYQGIPTYHMMRGNRAYAKGDVETCMAQYEKVYARGRMTPENKLYYGYLALRCGYPDKAERLFQAALVRTTDERTKMQAKSNMALVLWKRGELDEAVALLKEVFEVYQTTAVYGSLGYLLILQGKRQEALEFNLKAYEYNSDDNVIMDNLGQIYYLLRQYDKAEEMYEKMMKKPPEFPVPYYNYAQVMLAKGNKERALELLRQGLMYRFTYIAGVSEDTIRDLIERLETEE